MVKKIVKDEVFLQQVSELATVADEAVIDDLIDTLEENAEGCAGMAANMIGVKKRIIAINVGIAIVPMINPVIVKKEKPYETEEGCLSLEGLRKAERYDSIVVEYEDRSFNKQKQTFQGWIAQVIQHEIDHCNGILV